MNLTPVPTPKQEEFQNWEFGVFFHFGIRTFYEGHRDWDGLPMPAEAFNPTDLDCRQWASVARQAGAKYAILVTKHHDGFANWPTKYSDYSVARTPWKGGRGDVVREFTEACRAEGLGVGLYYSPAQQGFRNWSPREYDDYFVNQITELLTNYGKIDYLWFDACGSGDHQYDTQRIVNVIRSLQPEILLFNMWDPDTRWVGNESGVAGIGNRSYVRARDIVLGGDARETQELYLPVECDCCMRGQTWFYSDRNEDQLKTPEELFGLYCTSVGNSANLLINIGPDRRGLLPEKDAALLLGLGREVRRRFVEGAIPARWSVSEGAYVCTPEGAQTVGGVILEENLEAGEKISAFTLELHTNDGVGPIPVYRGLGVGHKRICRFPPLRATQIRVRLEEAEPGAALKNITLFK